MYDKIKQHLRKQKQQEDSSSDNDVKSDDIQPLRMFISGVGGTGKSFLIETIKCFVDLLLKQQCWNTPQVSKFGELISFRVWNKIF